MLIDSEIKGINERRQHVFLVLFCFFAVIRVGTSQTSVIPPGFTYAGIATDINGQPIPPGNYTFQFDLYDKADGGENLWGPLTCELRVDNKGFFSTILGPKDDNNRTLLDIVNPRNLFLNISVEITVGKKVQLLPRQQVLSAPYSFISSAGAPVGSIIAWVPPKAVTSIEEARKLLPLGFVICDGNTLDDPITTMDESQLPNLLDSRFLRGGTIDVVPPGGVAISETIGVLGGEASHRHEIHLNTNSVARQDDYATSSGCGNSVGRASANAHYHSLDVTTDTSPNIPKSLRVLFIMRVH